MAEINIKDYLFENIGTPNQTKVITFKRLGLSFELRALSAEDVTTLRKESTRRKMNPKTRLTEQELDQNRFTESILAASVVAPDLNNAELQTSWGCIGKPEKVLEKMLTAGEYNALTEQVMQLSGIGDNDTLVDDAKN